MKANLYALGAIALWATLATLGVSLRHLPPFLLTGIGLLIGSLLALPFVIRDRRQLQIPLPTLALGIYDLFGFHVLLFIALRHAPAVEANLVNYLWPLFMVVLAPLFLKRARLTTLQMLASMLGFAGAAVAILDSSNGMSGAWAWGYLPALGSAFIWASYSLLTKRVPTFPSAAIGLFGLVSGVLSLLCHWVLEPAAILSAQDWALLVLMGLGPLGAAFFLWDKALKAGDPRQIGILSYITPVMSTALLVLASGRALNWSMTAAVVMITAAAALGSRAK